MVDSAIQLLNNWGQRDPCVISNKIFDSGFLDSVCLTSTVVVNTSLHQLSFIVRLVPSRMNYINRLYEQTKCIDTTVGL